MLANLFHEITIIRRMLITPSLNKDIKNIIDKSDPSERLFGADMGDKIKAAKALEMGRWQWQEPLDFYCRETDIARFVNRGGRNNRWAIPPRKHTTRDAGDGSFRKCLQKCKITKNQVLLSWIKEYTLPFDSEPLQISGASNRKFSVGESSVMSESIGNLLRIGAFAPCKPLPGRFISGIFLADKPNGQKI
ncbi:hypothetical protein NQ315_004518 [Exocentrus adspersus]|uniref:Uncharacterized protein n=1 Tax=Exocentrus adspersus TaxID=1586481 RepID=A0AAV8V9I6_9CUCU|nr:hypothetical protein NQ315_004518 [Exocentrus adspersus]